MAATLFERIGKEKAVNAAVDLFYRKVLSDPRLKNFFTNVDMEGQRAKQKSFLTMVFGGPKTYKGKDLRAAHAGLKAKGLNESHFNAVAQHLQATLKELGVDAATTAEVMTIAASTKADVLNQ